MLREINLSVVVNLVTLAAAMSLAATLVMRMPGWIPVVAVSGCMIVNGFIAEWEDKRGGDPKKTQP